MPNSILNSVIQNLDAYFKQPQKGHISGRDIIHGMVAIAAQYTLAKNENAPLLKEYKELRRTKSQDLYKELTVATQAELKAEAEIKAEAEARAEAKAEGEDKIDESVEQTPEEKKKKLEERGKKLKEAKLAEDKAAIKEFLNRSDIHIDPQNLLHPNTLKKLAAVSQKALKEANIAERLKEKYETIITSNNKEIETLTQQNAQTEPPLTEAQKQENSDKIASLEAANKDLKPKQLKHLEEYHRHKNRHYLSEKVLEQVKPARNELVKNPKFASIPKGIYAGIRTVGMGLFCLTTAAIAGGYKLYELAEHANASLGGHDYYGYGYNDYYGYNRSHTPSLSGYGGGVGGIGPVGFGGGCDNGGGGGC